MTNGEMMQQAFPEMEVERGELYVYAWIEHEPAHYEIAWWDAEYKEPQRDYVMLTNGAYSELCLKASKYDELQRDAGDYGRAKTEIQKCIDVFAHSDNETGGYVQKGLEMALSILNKFVEVEE